MESKQKSVVLTFVLSMFPGVGHYYLGLMNRGLQFMLFFLGFIVAGNLLGIHELAAFIPAIWFYTLFDALQMAGTINSGEHVEDKPVISWNSAAVSQKMIGWGLVLIGAYSLLKILVPRFIPGAFYEGYMQTVIIAVVLIVVGVRILQPRKTIDVNGASNLITSAEILNPMANAYGPSKTESRTTADANTETNTLDVEKSVDNYDK